MYHFTCDIYLVIDKYRFMCLWLIKPVLSDQPYYLMPIFDKKTLLKLIVNYFEFLFDKSRVSYKR